MNNRRKNKQSYDKAVIWIVIAGVILSAAWIYASYHKTTEAATPVEARAIPADSSQKLYMTVIPSGLPSQIKEYDGFTVNFNKDNHTANWVGWELTAGHTDGTQTRSNNFWCDSEVKGCPDVSDYKRSGYDRGHIFPAAEAKYSQQAMYDCFTFANMTPQAHRLNSGAWKTLEDKERIWARRDKRLIIVAGPIYQKGDTQTIGAIKVRVPSGFFKVLLAPDLDSPRAIGFVYPNDYAPGNMQNYSMTVREVEQITGLDFFSALPDDIENTIESTTSFKEWNKN